DLAQLEGVEAVKRIVDACLTLSAARVPIEQAVTREEETYETALQLSNGCDQSQCADNEGDPAFAGKESGNNVAHTESIGGEPPLVVNDSELQANAEFSRAFAEM